MKAVGHHEGAPMGTQHAARTASTGATLLHARPSVEFEARLAHTTALLSGAAAEHGGRIVRATSLGAEDMVLTDLIARQHLNVAVGTLDTGVLHSQTPALLGGALLVQSVA